MTRAYLLLLTIIENDHIYIDHMRECFVIDYYGNKITLGREEIKDFITIFNNEIDELLGQLDIQ